MFGTLIAILLIIVIGGAIAMLLQRAPIDETLKQWGVWLIIAVVVIFVILQILPLIPGGIKGM